MLNSRYVHLHEALGLGVMWLQRNARLINVSDDANTQRLPEKNATAHKLQLNPPEMRSVTKQIEATLPARLQALQRVGSKSATTNASQSVLLSQTTSSEPMPIRTAQDWQNQLSGSIKRAKVMVLSVCASPDDVAAGKLFSGADGVLLDKMLAAVNLHENDVFLNTWLKDLPDFNPKPPNKVVQAALPRLQAEFALAGKPVLLLLGGFFEREDVKQAVAQLGQNVPTFHIAHPLRIISDPTLKRDTWTTLQAMQAVLEQ
ncbi:MAG: uracil-DNA glycosylase family protein [Alysiella sp.]|uniref:uracil-DNA glycosylase family protein n=1 Tax=Alysiella sp. TaxID=1872483 RepID=UPI0026DB4095|nr:uracil-DNA glycosylase family protein [Alysiella sp.]MDO4433191.1 uracil-DNA glycosylase family protein [Alysiella sp.]